jgi:RNA polymerase sigma factor (sigma-70 family)
MIDALRDLPERQREVLVLRYYSDLSEAQIAQTLDISPGAVKTHAHRGLSALRNTIDPAELS